MPKVLGFLGIALLFGACQLYNDALKPDRIEERYIQATRKGELLNGLKTEAIIVATHLNGFDSEHFKHEEGELFFIDIYLSDTSLERKDRGLYNPLYSVRLSNGATPLEITQLEKSDLLRYNITFASRWGEYFLVRFPVQTRRYLKEMSLEIVHKNLGIAKLDYGFKVMKKK